MLSGEALGQDAFAPPYLAPNSNAEVTNSGANYASGSSGIFDETGSFYVCDFFPPNWYTSLSSALCSNCNCVKNVIGLADWKSATRTANQLL